MTAPRSSPLHSGPAAGFGQPFEMLEACHERVQRMLALLRRLREHLQSHGTDEQARQAAADVMRYFDQAAPQHHRDEELHIFPPLLAQGEHDTVALVQLLQSDHREMELRWQAARAVLAAIASGAPPQPDAPDSAALDAFSSLYGAHLTAEEELVFPAARRLMDEQSLAAMGQEMQRRRGVA